MKNEMSNYEAAQYVRKEFEQNFENFDRDDLIKLCREIIAALERTTLKLERVSGTD